MTRLASLLRERIGVQAAAVGCAWFAVISPVAFFLFVWMFPQERGYNDLIAALSFAAALGWGCAVIHLEYADDEEEC